MMTSKIKPGTVVPQPQAMAAVDESKEQDGRVIAVATPALSAASSTPTPRSTVVATPWRPVKSPFTPGSQLDREFHEASPFDPTSPVDKEFRTKKIAHSFSFATVLDTKPK